METTCRARTRTTARNGPSRACIAKVSPSTRSRRPRIWFERSSSRCRRKAGTAFSTRCAEVLRNACFAARAARCSRYRRLATSPSRSLFALPAVVGIERGHFYGELRGVRAEILREDDAVMIHDERHDSARAALGGIRDQAEAADQAVANEILIGSARGMLTL